MEQQKEPRTVINVRVRRESKDALENRAARANMQTSDYHRACLAYAMAYMPTDYAQQFSTRARG